MQRFGFIQSVRGRLAGLVLLAMLALVGMLVYQQVQRQRDDRRHGDENLQRLAVFVAQAERERFAAASRLLVLAKQAESLRAVAANPTSTDAYDRCTAALFILDQLLPTTSGFALWDTSGNSLCSSKGAKVGEYSVAGKLWFANAVRRGDVATGDYDEAPPDNLPNIAFGAPIFDKDKNIIAYLSTGLKIDDTDALLAGANLPATGRVFVVDQNGTIINSSIGMSGQPTQSFNNRFAPSLNNFLDVKLADTPNGRRAAAVRVTDAGDTAVSVVVSAEPGALATPLTQSLLRNLWPVALVTLIIMIALWLLGQRWIVQPVRALVHASDAIAAGDLGARANLRSGVTEFERLGASFNDMAANRERATHAKDEFLGLVSHELKTPITMVLGNAEVLLRRADLLDPESRQGAVTDIYDSARRLDAIIENLLALARLERGADLESEPLILVRLVETCADAVRRRYPACEVRVHGDAGVLVLAGQLYIEQVVQNLLANAVKYSPASTPVDVIVERNANEGVVRVLDRGVGIAAEERTAIFQPFYRSDRTAQSAEGLGIGLSVCKRLIEAQAGRIWCDARPDGGTEFAFALPFVVNDASSGAGESEDDGHAFAPEAAAAESERTSVPDPQPVPLA